MISRRTLAFALAAGVIAVRMARLARAENPPKARNIVLVHGLFADGSCWTEVIAPAGSRAERDLGAEPADDAGRARVSPAVRNTAGAAC